MFIFGRDPAGPPGRKGCEDTNQKRSVCVNRAGRTLASSPPGRNKRVWSKLSRQKCHSLLGNATALLGDKRHGDMRQASSAKVLVLRIALGCGVVLLANGTELRILVAFLSTTNSIRGSLPTLANLAATGQQAPLASRPAPAPSAT